MSQNLNQEVPELISLSETQDKLFNQQTVLTVRESRGSVTPGAPGDLPGPPAHGFLNWQLQSML